MWMEFPKWPFSSFGKWFHAKSTDTNARTFFQSGVSESVSQRGYTNFTTAEFRSMIGFFSRISKNSHSTLGVTLTPFENRISTERDHLAATDHLLWRLPNFWSAHTVAKLENQLKCSRIINEVTHSLKPFRATIERTISPKGPKYPAYYVQLISFDSAPILQADCSRALFLSFSFQGIDHIHFTHRWSSSTASGRRFFFYPTEGTASYRTKLSSASS